LKAIKTRRNNFGLEGMVHILHCSSSCTHCFTISITQNKATPSLSIDWTDTLSGLVGRGFVAVDVKSLLLKKTKLVPYSANTFGRRRPSLPTRLGQSLTWADRSPSH
jgi:hypothetical protein